MRSKFGVAAGVILLGIFFAFFYLQGFYQLSPAIKLNHQPGLEITDAPVYLGRIEVQKKLKGSPTGLVVWEDQLWVTKFQRPGISVFTLDGLEVKSLDLSNARGAWQPSQMAFTMEKAVFSDWENEGLLLRDQYSGQIEFYNQLPSGDGISPQGVYVYGDIFYVANVLQKGWFAMDMEGEVITGVDGRENPEAGAEFPFGVLVTPDGRVILTDAAAGALKIYSCAGWYVGEIKHEQLVNPMGIAQDALGRIHVVDNGAKQILVFDNECNYLFTYGQGMVEPTVMAISQESRTIYVADPEAGIIKVWGY